MSKTTPLPPIDRRTLSTAFDRAIAESGEKTYLRFAGRSWSFNQAYDTANRFGAGLRQAGRAPQTPVGLLLDNSPDFVFAWLGIGLHRLIEVPINTALRGRFLSHVINDSGIDTLIVEAEHIDRIMLVESEIPGLTRLIVRGTGFGDEVRGRFEVSAFDDVFAATAARPEPARPDDLIGFMYTSGTTGPSKGVEITHVHAYTYSSQEDSSFISAEDTSLVTLPLFHLAGQWGGIYGALIHRLTCVLEPQFSASRFWSIIRENNVTVTTLLGAQAEILQQQPPTPGDATTGLRHASMAPLPSDLHGFCRRFGITSRAVYGMSEIGRVLEGRDPGDTRPGEAGMQRDGYHLKVVDTSGREVPSGVAGELWAKPEHPLLVMHGYHNLPEKTSEIIDGDGWVHTGDVFRVDEDGHFYFLDRMKDALRRRGENISSFEVESAVNEHPAVLESAVIGVPSELSEDDIMAFIVVRDDSEVDPEELIRFLAERMPYFMVPRYLEFVDELPKTPTHKIQKAVLRESGRSEKTWDREGAGITVTRSGIR